MKNLQKTKYPMLVVMMGLLFACGDATEAQLNGDPSQTTLGMKISTVANSTNGLVQGLVTSDQLNLIEAFACIEKIELELPEGLSCEDAGFVSQYGLACEEETEEEDGETYVESKIKAYGPFEINLLTGESSPSLADLQIPSGTYREIEFEFKGECSFGDEVSLVLAGTATDALDATHSFRMELEYDEELEIESMTEIDVLEDQTNEVFATLVVEDWFVNADWVGCIEDGNLTADGEGVFVIDENTEGDGECEDIYEDILDGIEDALDFEDENDDSDDDDDDSDDDDSDDHDD